MMILEMIQGIFAAVVFLISTPLFVIFSPVLVPAAIATTLLASGFTASGSLLSMAMSIISWIIKKRTGLDKLKIPGMSSISIVEAKDEDHKARLKGQKGEKDEKKKKQLKKDMKDKQKIDKKKDKKKKKDK